MFILILILQLGRQDNLNSPPGLHTCQYTCIYHRKSDVNYIQDGYKSNFIPRNAFTSAFHGLLMEFLISLRIAFFCMSMNHHLRIFLHFAFGCFSPLTYIFQRVIGYRRTLSYLHIGAS